MHVRQNDLELYLSGDLPDAATTEISSHVSACVECSEKLGETRAFLDRLAGLSEQQSANPSPAERRQSQRIPTNDPARVKLLHPTVSEPLPARILDVSKDGMKVELPCALEPGTIVEVLFKRFLAIAEVRYSVQVGEGFHAGVLIQDVFPKA
jgi:anti-sigma factor RsiW